MNLFFIMICALVNVILITFISRYIISLAYVACLTPRFYPGGEISSFSESCSPPVLCSDNCFLAVVCSVVVYEIICHLKPGSSHRTATIASVVLAMYPLHWFFTFLYYTDVASLTAVLAMYLACLKQQYRISALIAIIAVFIRQTNIVCIGILNKVQSHPIDSIKVDDSKPLFEETKQQLSIAKAGNTMRRRKLNVLPDDRKNSHATVDESSPDKSCGLLTEHQTVCLRAWMMKLELFLSFAPFLIVLLAFVVFVSWNGSVVLGAKEAHSVSPHFAQLMYFGIFSAFLMAPFHLSSGHISDMLLALTKQPARSFCYILLTVSACLIAVHSFSIAHPYLLADNRHYTFYLWRKLTMSHRSTKFFIVPAYVCSWFSIVHLLRKAQTRIWVLAYLLATAAVLVPAPLIEFR